MQSDVIYWFLLILFIGVFAEEKEVKQDSLVLLFENVTADNAENDVSLFVNGKRNASLIATFKYYMNGHISMYWKAGNYKKIFMDATRNIWIANIDENYKGKFYIQSSKKLGEVELIILKTNYSTPQKETTQKGDALPETTYSTTERTALKETTQKGDALPDTSSLMGYWQAIIVLICILILMVVIMKKDHILAWIQCKKSNSVPQPVQFVFHHDSPDSTSFQLMWYKPNDGGSPLIKYIIRYCEVKINPNGTDYELSKPLNSLEISPSDVSYTLSSLKPGSYYQVEVQAVNTVGMSSVSFIFKTKENHTNPKVHRLSRRIESLPPRNMPPMNNVTNFTDMPPSTGKDEQNSNKKSKKCTARAFIAEVPSKASRKHWHRS